MKSRKITALVAAASLLVSTWAFVPASAETLKIETFETLDNITASDTVAPVLGEISHTNDGSKSLSTSVNHMGSTYANAAADQTVEVWFYDSMDANATGVFRAGDTMVGINGVVNKNEYIVRTTAWKPSGIARFKGWHQIVIDGTNPVDGIKAYLDGVLVVPGKDTAQNTQISDILFANSWGGNGECYFDDLKFTDEPVVVDTENNGDATELKAAVIEAWNIDSDLYVKDANYDAYVAARLAANDVAVSINKTQAQIDEALTNLNEAKDALTLLTTGIKTFSIGGAVATIEGQNITVTMNNLANMVDYTLYGDKGSLTIGGEPLNEGDVIDISQPADIVFTPEAGEPITYHLIVTVQNANYPVPADAVSKGGDDLEALIPGEIIDGQGKWTSSNANITVQSDVAGKKGNAVYIKDHVADAMLLADEPIAAPFLMKTVFYDNGIEKHNMTIKLTFSNGASDFIGASINGAPKGTYQFRLMSNGSGARTEIMETNIKRSAGWHEFAVVADEEGNMNYFVDGVKVTKADGSAIEYKMASGASFTGISAGCAGWGGSDIFYIDDVAFYQLKAKIQVPGVIEKPEEGTLTDAIKAAAAEAGVSGEMTVNYGALDISGATIDADGVATLPEGVYGQYSGTVDYTISVGGSEVAKGTAKVTAAGSDTVAADSAVFDGWTAEEGGVSVTEAKTATFDFYAKAGTGIGIGTKIGVTFGRVQVIVKDSTGAVVAADKIDLFFPLQAVSKAIVVSNTVDNGDGTITVTPFAAAADGKYTVEIKAEGVGYTDISNKLYVTAVTLNQ